MTNHPKTGSAHDPNALTDLANKHLKNFMQEAVDHQYCPTCALDTLLLIAMVNRFVRHFDSPLGALDHGNAVVMGAIEYIQSLRPQDLRETVVRVKPTTRN